MSLFVNFEFGGNIKNPWLRRKKKSKSKRNAIMNRLIFKIVGFGVTSGMGELTKVLAER